MHWLCWFATILAMPILSASMVHSAPVPQRAKPVATSRQKPVHQGMDIPIIRGATMTPAMQEILAKALPLEGHRLARRYRAQAWSGDPLDLVKDPAYAEFAAPYLKAGNEFERNRSADQVREAINREHQALLEYEYVRYDVHVSRFSQYNFKEGCFSLDALEPELRLRDYPILPNNLQEIFANHSRHPGDEKVWGYTPGVFMPQDEAEALVQTFANRTYSISLFVENRKLAWVSRGMNTSHGLAGPAVFAIVRMVSAPHENKWLLGVFPNSSSASRSVRQAISKAGAILDILDAPVDISKFADVMAPLDDNLENVDFFQGLDSRLDHFKRVGVQLPQDVAEDVRKFHDRVKDRANRTLALLTPGGRLEGQVASQGHPWNRRGDVIFQVTSVDAATGTANGQGLKCTTVPGFQPARYAPFSFTAQAGRDWKGPNLVFRLEGLKGLHTMHLRGSEQLCGGYHMENRWEPPIFLHPTNAKDPLVPVPQGSVAQENRAATGAEGHATAPASRVRMVFALTPPEGNVDEVLQPSMERIPAFISQAINDNPFFTVADAPIPKVGTSRTSLQDAIKYGKSVGARMVVFAFVKATMASKSEQAHDARVFIRIQVANVGTGEIVAYKAIHSGALTKARDEAIKSVLDDCASQIHFMFSQKGFLEWRSADGRQH